MSLPRQKINKLVPVLRSEMSESSVS